MRILPFVVSIEGNIGTGKTTILQELEKKYVVFKECLPEWQQEGWLKEFYHDMSKNSLGFQMRVLWSQYNWRCKIERDFYGRAVIVERCPLTNNHIFGDALHDDKLLSDLSYDLFLKYSSELGWNPEKVIYLQCDSSTCLQRILQRDRQEEKNISIGYLRDLENAHERLYGSPSELNEGIDIAIIDSSRDINLVLEDVMKQMLKWEIQWNKSN